MILLLDLILSLFQNNRNLKWLVFLNFEEIAFYLRLNSDDS